MKFKGIDVRGGMPSYLRMANPGTYNPEKLEVAIYGTKDKGARGRQWKWMVCEKGGAPIESGIENGARQKALDAGNRAKANLIAKAQNK